MNQHPAEVVAISPEHLELCNYYLQNPSIAAVSENFGLTPHQVTQILDQPTSKRYIDRVFYDLGFNNRLTLRKAMDAIIARKFQELDEAGMGSTKDISELLMMSHKMTMESLAREIELEKLQQKSTSIKNQVNVQINDQGTNYGNLLHKLMKGSLDDNSI